MTMLRTLITCLFLATMMAAHSTASGMPTIVLDQPTESELIELMSEADAAHERGMALSTVDESAARSAFMESADGWQRILDSGLQNGYLWTNLGNAELRAGRLGNAVAAYLEADRLLPGNATVRANLTEARNQVPARFDPEGVVVLYDTVSDGWHILGFRARWWIAALSWVAFWSCLVVWIARGRRSASDHEGRSIAWRGLVILCGVIALLSAATVSFDVLEDTWRMPGVLVEESVVRSGNGDTFKAVFSEALPAGVEFDLLESRPGWHHVAFADGRQGWIRSDHVRVIGS